MWWSIKQFFVFVFGFLFWKTVFGVAWMLCVLEDHVWTPVWWFFNKHKYTKKQ